MISTLSVRLAALYVTLIMSVKPTSLDCTYLLVTAYLFRCAEIGRSRFDSSSKVWISSEAVSGLTLEKTDATSSSEDLTVLLSASITVFTILRGIMYEYVRPNRICKAERSYVG